MFDSLADQHPVELVAVRIRELGEMADRRLAERQGLDTVTLALTGNVCGWRFGQWKATEVVFDQDLPEGDHAQTHVVLRGANRSDMSLGSRRLPAMYQRKTDVSRSSFTRL